MTIQVGPLAIQFGGGAIFDTHGNFGTYTQRGAGIGAGAKLSGRAAFGFSTAETISDIARGPSTSASIGGGAGVEGSIDIGAGTSANTGLPYTTSGFTAGAGAGGGASVVGTWTTVTPIGCVTDGCKPPSAPAGAGSSSAGRWPGSGGAGGGGGGGIAGPDTGSGGGGGLGGRKR